jgi:hypothetical protein
VLVAHVVTVRRPKAQFNSGECRKVRGAERIPGRWAIRREVEADRPDDIGAHAVARTQRAAWGVMRQDASRGSA